MVTLQQRAAEEGLSALEILDSIRTRTGGLFDCECGDCLHHGDDFHAWEAFERACADAIHYAILTQAEQDALLASLLPEAVAIGQQLAHDLEVLRTATLEHAIDAITNLPRYRSDVGDMTYESGAAEGREEAVAAIRALIEASA